MCAYCTRVLGEIIRCSSLPVLRRWGGEIEEQQASQNYILSASEKDCKYELNNIVFNICPLQVFEGSSTKVKVGIKPNEGYNKKSPAIFHFQPQKRVSVETRVATATAVGNLGNAVFFPSSFPRLFAGSLQGR